MNRRWSSAGDVAARDRAQRFANDECGCGHLRREHADRSGAARGCKATTACPCRNYHRVKEAAPKPI